MLQNVSKRIFNKVFSYTLSHTNNNINNNKKINIKRYWWTIIALSIIVAITSISYFIIRRRRRRFAAQTLASRGVISVPVAYTNQQIYAQNYPMDLSPAPTINSSYYTNYAMNYPRQYHVSTINPASQDNPPSYYQVPKAT